MSIISFESPTTGDIVGYEVYEMSTQVVSESYGKEDYKTKIILHANFKFKIDDVTLQNNFELFDKALASMKNLGVDTVTFRVNGRKLNVPQNCQYTKARRGPKTSSITCKLNVFENFYFANLRNMLSLKTLVLRKYSEPDKNGWITVQEGPSRNPNDKKVINKGKTYQKKLRKINQTINRKMREAEDTEQD